MTDDSQPKPPAAWHAGTLTYTMRGLILVFALLLLGTFAISLKDRSIGSIFVLLYRKYHASNFLIGLICYSLPSVISMIFTPYFSVKSDRHRGRLGRRIPFLLLSIPLAGGGMVGVALAPRLAGWCAGFAGLAPDDATLMVLALMWGLCTLGNVLTLALFNALVNDILPAKLLGRFFGLFRAVSLLVGVSYNALLMKYAESHAALILIGLAAFFCLGLGLMCFCVREGTYPPAPEAVDRSAKYHLKRYFSECFRDRYYRLFYLYSALAFIGGSGFGAYVLPYAKSLEVPLDAYGNAMALMLAVSFVMSFVLGPLADKFHPLRAGLLMMIAVFVFHLCGVFMISGVKSFLLFFTVNGILAGSYGTLAMSIPMRLLPKSHFGQFSSAAMIVNNIFSLLYIPVLGFLVDLFGGEYRIVILTGAVLMAAALVAGALLYRNFLTLGGVTGYVAPLPGTMLETTIRKEEKQIG